MILMRIVLVGIFWSILFIEGIRTTLLINWHFDIFRTSHWEFAWNLWLSGWVIKSPKEWAFILIILTFIPLWLSGWAALGMVKWGKILSRAMVLPLKIFNKIFEKQVTKIAHSASVKVVKKKKSYKEIRPKSIRPPLEESSYSLPGVKSAAVSAPQAIPAHLRGTAAPSAAAPAPAAPAQFDHSLFQFDDDTSGFDFDLFDDKPAADTAPAPEASPPPPPKNENRGRSNNNASKPDSRNRNRSNNNNAAASTYAQAPRASSNSTLDVLRQKGYEVVTGATIKNTLIDFIGVAAGQICLCLNDKEPGDWLADEERFNDEEPLWFSESSHRISPVRKIDIARTILKDKLAEAGFDFSLNAYVIIQIGNIINAEDMFEIWNDMKINVVRIDRGTPKEIRLFAKALDDVDEKIAPDKFEKIKKLIRSIA